MLVYSSHIKPAPNSFDRFPHFTIFPITEFANRVRVWGKAGLKGLLLQILFLDVRIVEDM